METRERIAYPILMILGALDAAGYSVIAPVIPAIARETDSGPALVGALVASFPMGIMVGFFLAAQGVKRGHSTAVLLASLGLAALGSLAFVAGDSLEIYFAGRLVMGLGSGGVWIGVTFGTLERWPGCEYLCMSRIFSAYAVGAVVGPAIGSIGGIRAPFSVYLVLLCASGGLVVLMGRPATSRTFAPDLGVLRLPGFWLASSSVLLVVLALGTMDGVLPLHLAERLSQGEIGALYAGASLLMAGSAAVAAQVRPRPLVVASVALVVSGIALAGLTDIVPLWIMAFTLSGVGAGAGYTGSAGILLETVGSERIVTAIVVWSQLGIVGYLIGSLAGGPVAQAFGFAALGLVPATAGVFVLLTLARARATG